MTVARALEAVLGPDPPVAVRAYDGTRLGPDDAAATLVVHSPVVFRRLVTAPGELGLGRAYVSGELDVEGDLYAALSALRGRVPDVRTLGARGVAEVARAAAAELRRSGLSRPPIPAEEARLRGRRHTKARDAAAIAHHYDVSNAFYRLVLGPSMTYSCAVWASPEVTLEDAQTAKNDLVCRKLGLEPGMRLLDVGCGWGGLVLHAAERHGVRAVGVTLSRRQAEWAGKAVAEAGLADRVEIRHQDYRDVRDGPFDAISSIGMFEHVGAARLREYFTRVRILLRPGGRFVNHGIARPPNRGRTRFRRRSFIDRYVFPDGELHEIGNVVSAIQGAGFEVRHVENLREHYALTLRAWVHNLEGRWDEAVAEWDEAVAEVGAGRARVWRLYMAASALNFEAGRTQVHQVLAVRPDGGRSGLPLRPAF
ncbi:MAG TPA: class I SAM-dependent methyltransferase [Actinomycetota bacterium]|nr:class I SAM-dependent methyltransferase [Actinomycetota bacterium]